MALTSLNPNLLGTDSAGASKLSTTGGLVQLHSTGVFTIANTSANNISVANTGAITFAGAASGITTLAAGNTNITGFANISSNAYIGGNLGINNSTPAVLANTVQIAIKANVNGDSMFVAQNSNGLTTAKFGFQYSGGVDNPAIGSYSDHPLVFLTNNTEKMRIAADGQLYHNVSYLLGSSYNAYHGKTSTSTNVVSGSFTDTGLVVASVYIPTNVRKVFAWIHFTLRSNGLAMNHTGVRFKVVRASDSNITYVGNGSWGFGITQTINNTGHATVTQFVNLYDYDSSGNQAGLTAGQTYSFTLQATDAFASGGQLRFAGEAGGTHENYTPAHATIWVL